MVETVPKAVGIHFALIVGPITRYYTYFAHANFPPFDISVERPMIL
jgi:hypothetical protein